jgi:hypothetical protein
VNKDTQIIYRIDRSDAIVFVNEGWRTFADANGAPDLAREVTGRPLWDSVAGIETTMLWREIVARARSGLLVSFPYRCDSPSQRRQLAMQVAPLEGGGVEFVSTISRVEDRDPVALLSSHYPEGSPVRSCSWCRRFDAGGFVEVEEAILRLGLLEQEDRPITHTICERCEQTVLEALEQAKASA